MVRTELTAQYPGSLLTASEVGEYTNNVSVELTEDITSGETVWGVSDTDHLKADMYLSTRGENGYEIVQISSVDASAKTVTVTRGEDGTTAVAHDQGQDLWPSIPARGLNQLTLDLIATQSKIGTTATSGTQGGILFADGSGNFAQDVTNLFWDDTNNELELGDDVNLILGAGDDYWFNYDSTNTQLELNSTDVDGGGTDGLILHIGDGAQDTTWYGSLLTDTDASSDLGASGARWNNLYAEIGHFDLQAEFTPISAPSHTEGLVYYDSTDKALTYYNEESAVALQIGRESYTRVRNVSGSTISNGDVVYITGFNSGNGLATVDLAQADSLSTADVAGVATHDIEDNSNGYITTVGIVRDFDTSSFSAGDKVYLSPSTAGGLTTTEPSNPNFSRPVGFIVRSSAGSGELMVELQERAHGLFTQGSIPFAGSNGLLAQDNSELFWDDSNNRLGVGTSSPTSTLHVGGTSEFDDTLLLKEGAGQDYRIEGEGDFLKFLGQSASTGAAIEVSSNNNDGTDDIAFILDALGDPAETDRELLRLKYDAGSTQFELMTEATGTGTVRDLVIFAGANTDQFVVRSDGDLNAANSLLVGGTGTPTDTLDVDGTASISGEVTLQQANQDFKLVGEGGKLHLEAQGNDLASFRLSRLGGDGTQARFFEVWASGDAANPSNREKLQLGYDGSNYVIKSALFGTGTVHPIKIQTDGNPDQLVLATDGNNSMSGKLLIGGTGSPTDTLDVNGSMNVSGSAVINEGGGNNDFRVEGDTEPNLLFADASTDRVGIGTATPGVDLDVSKAFTGTTHLRVINTETGAGDQRAKITISGENRQTLAFEDGAGTQTAEIFQSPTGLNLVADVTQGDDIILTPTGVVNVESELQINATTLFESDRDFAVDLIPNADNTLDVGSSTRRIAEAWIQTGLAVGVSTRNFLLHEAGGNYAHLGAPNSSPTTADMDNGSVIMWLDETNDEVEFVAKYSDGTVKTGTQAVS